MTAGFGVLPDQAYPALLEKGLKAAGYPNTIVANRGICGETSGELRRRTDYLIAAEKPDYALIETGINDLLLGIPPAQTADNIGAVITALQNKRIIVLLLGMEIWWNRKDETVIAFNAMYEQLSKQYKVSLVPAFLHEVAGKPKLNFADGIHPTGEGYEHITANLLPFVLDLLGQ